MRFSLKTLLLAAVVTVATSHADAQPRMPTPIPAPAQPGAIPLGQTGVPGSLAEESWFKWEGVVAVRNVQNPTLTPYLPKKGTANGAAVIIAPGGAFHMLSMGREENVAHFFTDRGVAAFIMKYRVRPTPADDAGFADVMANMARRVAADPTYSKVPDYSYSDALAALKMVRDRSIEWGVDPKRVGMFGYSSGARLSREIALRAPEGQGANFVGVICGPMMEANVPASAPPLFAALAVDDPIFANFGFGLIDSWKKASKAVELHVYQDGGHCFQGGQKGHTNARWLEQFFDWVNMNGFLNARK